jgi:hypothetical protein
MAELVNETGQRMQRNVMRKTKEVVYVGLGLSGRAQGFFIKNGKPIPSNPFKHLKMTTTFMEDR